MMVHVEADRAGKGGFAEVDDYNGVYYVIDILDYTRPHTHMCQDLAAWIGPSFFS